MTLFFWGECSPYFQTIQVGAQWSSARRQVAAFKLRSRTRVVWDWMKAISGPSGPKDLPKGGAQNTNDVKVGLKSLPEFHAVRCHASFRVWNFKKAQSLIFTLRAGSENWLRWWMTIWSPELFNFFDSAFCLEVVWTLTKDLTKQSVFSQFLSHLVYPAEDLGHFCAGFHGGIGADSVCDPTVPIVARRRVHNFPGRANVVFNRTPQYCQQKKPRIKSAVLTAPLTRHYVKYLKYSCIFKNKAIWCCLIVFVYIIRLVQETGETLIVAQTSVPSARADNSRQCHVIWSDLCSIRIKLIVIFMGCNQNGPQNFLQSWLDFHGWTSSHCKSCSERPFFNV